MKVTVDASGCIGCGLCESICPDVFKMNDHDIAEVLVDKVPDGVETSCREAAEGCPVQVISLEE